MLKTENLNYRHGNKRLISNFNYEFIPGKIYGIVGLNGSGKTTLMKILAGIWTQTSGSILWNDINLLGVTRQEKSKLISLVPQTPHVPFDYKVFDVVAMGGYARNKLVNNEETVLHALDSVQGAHLTNCLITEISSGEKQRVFIARALVTKSPVILLDEPTASLDVKHKSIIWELMVSLKNKGKIIIITTHDLDMAEKYCDNIILMNEGKCLMNGTFKDVMNENTMKTIFSA
ncbi:MAG: ABC transporter ATP-binding protein [Chlamydiota bacterium]|nr:ABC transporter ATP-binding protein [Chlamydiota bacterium]